MRVFDKKWGVRVTEAVAQKTLSQYHAILVPIIIFVFFFTQEAEFIS